MFRKISFFVVLFLSFQTLALGQVGDQRLADHLQDVSVTVKSVSGFTGGFGSGVLITRGMKRDDDSEDKVKVNFVLTAAHVVDNLRHVRDIITPNGETRKKVEFDDARIIKELVSDGRRVGELQMDCKVLKYSDAEHGEDLALLMVRKPGYVDVSTSFHLEDEIPPIGTKLFHVGSLLGQAGSNSMTNGIVSQVGRVLEVGTGNVFDQSNCTAFPGSSGGGMFIAEDGLHKGEYCGMLVRGAGEGFNFYVPVRRILTWAEKNNLKWVFDESLPQPTLKSLNTLPIEGETTNAVSNSDSNKESNFLWFEKRIIFTKRGDSI